MISKICSYCALIALIVVALIKFIQLYGYISHQDLIIRVLLWSLGSFILIKIIGKLAGGAILLAGKEAAEVEANKSIDYTVGAAYPDTAIAKVSEKEVKETTKETTEEAVKKE